MLTERLLRSALHHANPERRLIAVAKLPPESGELATLLATDPAPEVRVAAANRCGNPSALSAAMQNEPDATVRAALHAALVSLLSEGLDTAQATAFLATDQCTDAVRVDVAGRAPDAERRRSAIAAIREEAVLVELAHTGEHAETRLAAADHVHTPDGLRKLAHAAKDKDRGVVRLTRIRLEAMANREGDAAEADAIVAQLEALASRPGPILMAVIELNRRWQALNLGDDPERLARCEAARRTLQARFDREHAAHRAHARFEQRLSEWVGRAEPPVTSEGLNLLRSELAALRAEGQELVDTLALSRLDEAEQRIERWAQELQACAGAEAIVVEAEQLAAGTSIDAAKLPERWQALDRSVRTHALTQRFESALIVIEQRRLAQVRVAEQEALAARQQVHALLHIAEQALAAGQLQAARAAADEIKACRPRVGPLPKPTLQRISRLAQELKELEGWESFGQRQARIQLCERADAAATLTLDAPRLAAEVQKLRSEWSALDQKHGVTPKAMRERFDRACAKAYAPAARYFAEQAALQKESRKKREDFIASAAAQVATLLVEPRDWRAIERWLREADRRWRDGDLGSMDPKTWKGLDARFRAELAPLRDALSASRDEAKARRLVLIEEATALAARAQERDAPAQVKAIQVKWQAQAKELLLTRRDEQALWEQFRSACDAVFQARDAKRKQEDALRHEARGALERICSQLEALALATDKQEQDVRRELRDLQGQWMHGSRAPGTEMRGLETRFTNAKKAVETALSARTRAREAAVWSTLAAKERLCEELDRLLCAGERAVDAAALHARWAVLAALPAAWEKAMAIRRDTALRALADEVAAAAHVGRIERDAESRGEILLELELLLGLECPPELQARRRALQLRQLRDRFQGGATHSANSAGERLLAWCAQPGVTDARDRQRCERVFSAMAALR